MKYSFAIYNSLHSNINKTLESINNFNYNKNLIEVFIDSNIEEDIINKYDFEIIKVENKNDEASFYNYVIEKFNGEYISFINSSCYYDNKNLLNKLNNINENIISINSKYFDLETEKIVNYLVEPKKTKYVDLNIDPFSISINLGSYFFKKEIVENKKFINNLHYSDLMIMDLYLEYNKYYFLRDYSIISFEPFTTNTSKNSIQYNKDWYNNSLKIFLEYLKNLKEIPVYIQEYIMYLIFAKYNCNTNDRTKNVLDEEEINEFFTLTNKCFKYINGNIIMNNNVINGIEYESKHVYTIPKWLRCVFINDLRKDYKYEIDEDGNYYLLTKSDKILYSNVNDAIVYVRAINYKNNKLKFDCNTNIKNVLNDDNLKIYALYDNKKINIKEESVFSLLKTFGKTRLTKFEFSFEIPLDTQNKKDLKLVYEFNNKKYNMMFKYNKVQSRLSDSNYSFWSYKNFLLRNKTNKIIIEKTNCFKVFKNEILFDLAKLKNVKKKTRAIKYIGLRWLYYITKPFNKDVWLTWDKLYKAGDNGEYIYHYSLNHNKNCYYFIKKDSLDYERLKKENKKHIVVYNSLKAKLLSLHSTVILDTHANVISYCGFDGIAKTFAAGLFNPEIICIQHGLSMQDIAQYQNRLFDNIKYYCCASKYEVENLGKPIYGYDKENIVITGLARYDGLKSNDKKIILITPTWRRNVVNSSVAHMKKVHNDNFINSDYYKIYNSLINNQELVETAKKNKYRIIYLLHPAMSGQLEDYKGDPYIEIIPATGDMNYEKILTESSVMVTDYSGVQYDFAYQRKVLLYYHPDALPPHYDTSSFNYENQGFGPVLRNEKDLVKELCYYMNNKCVIKEEYKSRADDFFKYDDFNNCERIIEEIEKYLDSID